jgi:hypothetical protein
MSDEPTTEYTRPPLVIGTPPTAPANAVGQAVGNSRHIGLFDGKSGCGRCFWIDGDYLGWWVRPQPLAVPLVTSGPSTDPIPGAIGQPHTSILFGGNGIPYNMQSGFRVSGGMWAADQRIGLELGGFWLGRTSTNYGIGGNSSGNPYIAIPFLNALNGREDVLIVSQNFPNALDAKITGSVNVNSSSQLWGYEANALWNIRTGPRVGISLIAGFRSARLTEQVQIDESIRNLPGGGSLTFGGANAGQFDSVSTYDSFSARNTFYGGQLGIRTHWEESRWSIDLTAKVALGVSNEVLNIAGASALQDIVGTSILTIPGGVFALPSNMGNHEQNKFAVLPEGMANVVTNHTFIRAGYTVFYWSNVMRPGNQIDRTLNPGQIPTDSLFGTAGTSHPTFLGQTGSFVAQGFNVGIEFRY